MMNDAQVGLGSLPRLVVFWALMILCVFTLSACGGGILGTGDGTDIIDASADSEGGGLAPVEEAPTETPDSSVEVQTTSFSNTEIVTDRTDALIRIIQADPTLTDSIVVTNRQNNDQPLLPLPGLFFADGADQYRALLAADDHQIQFYLSDDFRAGNASFLAEINPLDLGMGTITTLIGRLSDNEQYEILPLVTKASSGDANSLVRVVYAAKAFSAQESVNFQLSNNSTGSIPINSLLNYINSPASDYAKVAAGQYTLEVRAEGSENETEPVTLPLNIGIGQVLTLVLRDNLSGDADRRIEVLVVVDSALVVE